MEYEKLLIGELVGLARATEGNEHLITDEVTQVITDTLSANAIGEEDFPVFRERIENTKRLMVPDCFLCACPCGRTSAYDMSRIEQETPEIRAVKERILSQLKALSAAQPGTERDTRLYRGLIAIGLEGYSADELWSIFTV